MCGRYSLTAQKEKLKAEFALQDEHLAGISPRYNIAPSQIVPTLVSEQNLRRIELCRWGLVPSWSKDPTIGNRMINARKETLTDKPSYRAPFKNHRCLVIADGFFEWKQEGRRKRPYYVRLKSGAPFGFAGLWSHWESKAGGKIISCCIITGEPNDLMKSIHTRMPIIIKKNDRDLWLDHSRYERSKLLSLLEPYPSEEMEAFPVATLVNSPANDRAECIENMGQFRPGTGWT